MTRLSEKSPTVIPPTPSIDVRKESSEILKRIDQLIKGGQIEPAIREIIHAKEIDPANIYVRAYEERLAYLKEQHEKNIDRERTKKEAEEAARKREEELGIQLEEERQRQKLELARREEERERREVRTKIEQERLAAIKTGPTVIAHPANDDAKKPPVDPFKRASPAGNIPPQPTTELQKPFGERNSSRERQRTVDSQTPANVEPKPGRETILVIDDDEQLLHLVSRLLADHGYTVTSCSTSDEALALLKNWKPNLILSDIDLKTSTMGGFGFYESVRKLSYLSDVPFIFVSGMNDGVLIRKGKELGVDDYLTKPVSEENLLAVVKGKLKRFKSLSGPP